MQELLHKMRRWLMSYGVQLADYIAKRKMSIPEAAAELGCTRGHLWRLARRWSLPRPDLAKRIVEWSGGNVGLGDLMDVLPDRPRQKRKAAA